MSKFFNLFANIIYSLKNHDDTDDNSIQLQTFILFHYQKTFV